MPQANPNGDNDFQVETDQTRRFNEPARARPVTLSLLRRLMWITSIMEVALGAACSTTGLPTAAMMERVSGKAILIASSCGTQSATSSYCSSPEEPLAVTHFIVKAAHSGEVVARFTTAADGSFEIQLPRSTYRVELASPSLHLWMQPIAFDTMLPGERHIVIEIKALRP